MKRIRLARFLLWFLGIFPKRYGLMNKQSSGHQPFFIFGSGRNGSTLLNIILNQHPGIFIPPEQYFLGNSIIKYQLYNYIIWRDLVKVVFGELMNLGDSHKWEYRPDAIIKEAFSLTGKDRTLENLLQLLYNDYSKKNGKEMVKWGDSTHINTRYAHEVYTCFPKAKYIFLVRDGRDVVASYKKGGESAFGEFHKPEMSSVRWTESIKKFYWLKRRTNVFVVKYEELVSNPEQILRNIVEYLDLEYDPNMLEYHDNIPNIEGYKQEHHKNLQKAITSDSIGQWRDILESHERELIIDKLKPHLKAFNYL